MSKKYNVIVVDDHTERAESALADVAKRVNEKAGYQIEPTIIPFEGAAKRLLETNADIVLVNVTSEPRSNPGMNVLNEYRRENKRTKVILYVYQYGQAFPLEFAFIPDDWQNFINVLDVSAITDINDTASLARFIIKAIEDIDAVMISLEDLILNYGEDGYFEIGEKQYSPQQLLRELRMGTPAGDAFRREVLQNTIAYFMKFGD